MSVICTRMWTAGLVPCPAVPAQTIPSAWIARVARVTVANAARTTATNVSTAVTRSTAVRKSGCLVRMSTVSSRPAHNCLLSETLCTRRWILRRKCRHIEIFVTGCTVNCYFENFVKLTTFTFHRNEWSYGTHKDWCRRIYRIGNEIFTLLCQIKDSAYYILLLLLFLMKYDSRGLSLEYGSNCTHLWT